MNSIIGKLVWHLQYYDIFNVLMDKKENGHITTKDHKYLEVLYFSLTLLSK